MATPRSAVRLPPREGVRTRRMWRGVTTGASSRFGTGGAMTVSPEGNRKTQLPLAVVPTTQSWIQTRREVARSGRATGRSGHALVARFSFGGARVIAFLTFSEEFGGLASSASRRRRIFRCCSRNYREQHLETVHFFRRAAVLPQRREADWLLTWAFCRSRRFGHAIVDR